MACPAAVAAIALLAGAALGRFWPDLPADAAASVIVLAWAHALVAFACAEARFVVGGCAAGVLAAGVLAGGQAEARARHPPLRQALAPVLAASVGEPLVIEGILRTDAEPAEYGAALEVEIDRVGVPGRTLAVRGGVRLTVGGAMTAERLPQWRAGRRIRAPALLREPARFLNPGVPDQADALARHGVAYLGTIKSAALVEMIAPGSVPSELAGDLREATRRIVRETVGCWSARSAAVVTAVLIGDRAGLTAEVEDRLQAAGTYHVIAISGGNVAIVAGLLLWLLRLARVSPRTSSLAAIAALAAYGYVIVSGPSVDRATIVAIAYLAARLLDHRAPPLNALAVGAAMLVTAEPLVVYDVAFALTFGATLAIIIGAGRLLAWSHAPRAGARGVRPPRWWIRAPLLLLAATVCAETALFPISARVFSRVTAAGLVLNFAAIPLMTMAQLAGLGSLAVAAGSTAAARATGFAAHAAAFGLIESTRLLDWAPWLTGRVPPPGVPTMATYYAAIVIVLLARRRSVVRHTAMAVALACAGWMVAAPAVALPVGWTTPGRAATGRLRVTVLDVGQGDATLVQFPRGGSLLVDAGGLAGTSALDVGSRFVVPAAWALGVRRLDVLALTHGDPDHIGGAPAVVRDLNAREVWEGVPVPPHVPLQAIAGLADAAGAGWRTLQTGDILRVQDVTVRVWHPPPADWERQRVRNDDSLVLELRTGDVSILLPGDISRSVEAVLASRLSLAPLTVLKVPHHGSGGSSSRAFIAAIHPAAAIVSAGRGNRFGHPTADVLERYREAGAEMFRTDEDGAVTVETDGRRVDVRTMTGRAWTSSTSQ